MRVQRSEKVSTTMSRETGQRRIDAEEYERKIEVVTPTTLLHKTSDERDVADSPPHNAVDALERSKRRREVGMV
jgi:hypothetical protein